MCGLCGVYSPSPLTTGELNKLSRLLLLSHFRGAHSTGFFTLSEPEKGKSPRILHWKGLEHPVDFAINEWEAFENKTLAGKKPNSIAFHTRQATKGLVIKENAHPFNFANVIGMHNGTFHSGLKYEKDCETDSEALYKEIDEIGFEAFIKAHTASGAMALVFYDKKKKTLNFYRNSQRPLHFLGQARAMYWASESRDLINAVGIIEKETPLPFSETDTGIIDGKVYSLPEETLVSIDISKCNYTWSMKKIAPPVPKYVHRYGQSFDSEWNDNSQPWNNEHRNYNSSNMTFLELARKKLSIMGLTSLTKAVSRGPFHVRFGKNFEPITDTSIISVSPRTEYTSYAGWESETKILPSYYRTGETRYAVELNSFMSNWMYEQLCTFRKANPEVFLKKLQSTFLKQDKTSRLCSARLLGISLNTLQQLVRGKSKVFNSYVFEPYTHNNVGNLCILKNVSLLGEEKLKNYVSTNDRRELALTAPFTKSEIAAATSEVDDSVEFSFEEVAVKDGTVPPFKKPTPLLLSQSQGGFREGEGFPAGLSGKLVSKEHYLDRIRVGCVCCCSGVPLHEDIFWLDDVAFLCEACQETLTKPEHLNSAVSLNCAQDLQNIEDQIAARNLLKRQENRNVLLN